MKTLHERINFRGNKEQHMTIGGYPGWRFGNTVNRRRKGVVIANKTICNKTGKSINYFEFY